MVCLTCNDIGAIRKDGEYGWFLCPVCQKDKIESNIMESRISTSRWI